MLWRAACCGSGESRTAAHPRPECHAGDVVSFRVLDPHHAPTKPYYLEVLEDDGKQPEGVTGGRSRRRHRDRTRRPPPDATAAPAAAPGGRPVPGSDFVVPAAGRFTFRSETFQFMQGQIVAQPARPTPDAPQRPCHARPPPGVTAATDSGSPGGAAASLTESTVAGEPLCKPASASLLSASESIDTCDGGGSLLGNGAPPAGAARAHSPATRLPLLRPDSAAGSVQGMPGAGAGAAAAAAALMAARTAEATSGGAVGPAPENRSGSASASAEPPSVDTSASASASAQERRVVRQAAPPRSLPLHPGSAAEAAWCEERSPEAVSASLEACLPQPDRPGQIQGELAAQRWAARTPGPQEPSEAGVVARSGEATAAATDAAAGGRQGGGAPLADPGPASLAGAAAVAPLSVSRERRVQGRQGVVGQALEPLADEPAPGTSPISVPASLSVATAAEAAAAAGAAAVLATAAGVAAAAAVSAAVRAVPLSSAAGAAPAPGGSNSACPSTTIDTQTMSPPLASRRLTGAAVTGSSGSSSSSSSWIGAYGATLRPVSAEPAAAAAATAEPAAAAAAAAAATADSSCTAVVTDIKPALKRSMVLSATPERSHTPPPLAGKAHGPLVSPARSQTSPSPLEKPRTLITASPPPTNIVSHSTPGPPSSNGSSSSSGRGGGRMAEAAAELLSRSSTRSCTSSSTPTAIPSARLGLKHSSSAGSIMPGLHPSEVDSPLCFSFATIPSRASYASSESAGRGAGPRPSVLALSQQSAAAAADTARAYAEFRGVRLGRSEVQASEPPPPPPPDCRASGEGGSTGGDGTGGPRGRGRPAPPPSAAADTTPDRLGRATSAEHRASGYELLTGDDQDLAPFFADAPAGGGPPAPALSKAGRAGGFDPSDQSSAYLGPGGRMSSKWRSTAHPDDSPVQWLNKSSGVLDPTLEASPTYHSIASQEDPAQTSPSLSPNGLTASARHQSTAAKAIQPQAPAGPSPALTTSSHPPSAPATAAPNPILGPCLTELRFRCPMCSTPYLHSFSAQRCAYTRHNKRPHAAAKGAKQGRAGRPSAAAAAPGGFVAGPAPDPALREELRAYWDALDVKQQDAVMCLLVLSQEKQRVAEVSGSAAAVVEEVKRSDPKLGDPAS
ncbi:MAG: hypothetical protein WDW36_008320 [Sanguina aurantia]